MSVNVVNKNQNGNEQKMDLDKRNMFYVHAYLT